jgi:hypothetical protein
MHIVFRPFKRLFVMQGSLSSRNRARFEQERKQKFRLKIVAFGKRYVCNHPVVSAFIQKPILSAFDQSDDPRGIFSMRPLPWFVLFENVPLQFAYQVVLLQLSLVPVEPVFQNVPAFHL